MIATIFKLQIIILIIIPSQKITTVLTICQVNFKQMHSCLQASKRIISFLKQVQWEIRIMILYKETCFPISLQCVQCNQEKSLKLLDHCQNSKTAFLILNVAPTFILLQPLRLTLINGLITLTLHKKLKSTLKRGLKTINSYPLCICTKLTTLKTSVFLDKISSTQKLKLQKMIKIK